MDRIKQLNHLREMISAIETKPKEDKPMSGYRFDIFKGAADENGKVNKIRSVGSAFVREGHRTYTVTLKTFLNERFYLLSNLKPENKTDFVILTRETAQNIARKYFWNSVGDGEILDGVNHGLMKLSWDVLSDGLYMSLHPFEVNDPAKLEGDIAA